MDRVSKAAEWQERLADFSASGMTQKQWCGEHGVPLHQFNYWRRRLMTSETPQRDASGSAVTWCEVQLSPEAAPTCLTVRVGAAGIEVKPGFDAGLLRAVVWALQEPETVRC